MLTKLRTIWKFSLRLIGRDPSSYLYDANIFSLPITFHHVTCNEISQNYAHTARGPPTTRYDQTAPAEIEVMAVFVEVNT